MCISLHLSWMLNVLRFEHIQFIVCNKSISNFISHISISILANQIFCSPLNPDFDCWRYRNLRKTWTTKEKRRKQTTEEKKELWCCTKWCFVFIDVIFDWICVFSIKLHHTRKFWGKRNVHMVLQIFVINKLKFIILFFIF